MPYAKKMVMDLCTGLHTGDVKEISCQCFWVRNPMFLFHLQVSLSCYKVHLINVPSMFADSL
jgi:hypothetical protein